MNEPTINTDAEMFALKEDLSSVNLATLDFALVILIQVVAQVQKLAPKSAILKTILADLQNVEAQLKKLIGQ